MNAGVISSSASSTFGRRCMNSIIAVPLPEGIDFLQSKDEGFSMAVIKYHEVRLEIAPASVERQIDGDRATEDFVGFVPYHFFPRFRIASRSHTPIGHLETLHSGEPFRRTIVPDSGADTFRRRSTKREGVSHLFGERIEIPSCEEIDRFEDDRQHFVIGQILCDLNHRDTNFTSFPTLFAVKADACRASRKGPPSVWQTQSHRAGASRRYGPCL